MGGGCSAGFRKDERLENINGLANEGTRWDKPPLWHQRALYRLHTSSMHVRAHDNTSSRQDCLITAVPLTHGPYAGSPVGMGAGRCEHHV